MPNKKEAYFFKVGCCACDFGHDCLSVFSFTKEVIFASIYAVKHPFKVRWRETFYYMDSCGSDAVPIVAVVGFLMGLVLALQGAIQLNRFGAKGMVMELVAIALLKELGPLLTAIVATGRAGSAFAAEIGTMKVTEEIDAMVTMGFDKSRFLVIPKLLAMVIVLPILTLIGDIAGFIGGTVIAYFELGISIPMTYNTVLKAITFSSFMEGLVKSVVFAFLIAAIGCMRGFQTKNDAQSVGRSTTSAVVSGIFLVAVADTVLTIIFSLT
ncbi:MAG: ABC transporter permease [bacterium]|nr:ABC transporter permease [bacterium]